MKYIDFSKQSVENCSFAVLFCLFCFFLSLVCGFAVLFCLFCLFCLFTVSSAIGLGDGLTGQIALKKTKKTKKTKQYCKSTYDSQKKTKKTKQYCKSGVCIEKVLSLLYKHVISVKTFEILKQLLL